MQKLLIVILLAFVNVGFAQQYSEHYYKQKAIFENTPDTKNEIIFLGNSITEGGNWKELFPKVNAINRGISGDVTDGILNRLDEVISSQPQKIFLLIGTNDLARGKSVPFVTDNYRKIIETIQNNTPKTILYIQSVLPVNPMVGNKFLGHKSKQQEINAVNKNLKALALEFNCVYINLYQPFSNSSGNLKSKFTHDGLHLNQAGYKRWKKTIEKYIN